MTNSGASAAFWCDRPTFVTGATGLVGAWVVRRLLELKADVLCLVRDHVPQAELVRAGLEDKVKIISGNVIDQHVLERALGEYEIDSVIHLAAQTTVPVASRNPVSTFETNIGGTWALLEACRRSPKVRQIVIASSDKAYGAHPRLPYTEETPLKGQYPYDVSKSCADLIAQAYAETYDLPVVITRCGNFFGGGDLNWNRLVPGTIRSALRTERPVIRSDGRLVRDYLYVEDGAFAYTLLIEKLAEDPKLRGQAFNFSLEMELEVSTLALRILQLMGSALGLDIRGEATNEIARQSLCADKARRILGWKPLFDFDRGLVRTIEWYRDFLGARGMGDA